MAILALLTTARAAAALAPPMAVVEAAAREAPRTSIGMTNGGKEGGEGGNDGGGGGGGEGGGDASGASGGEGGAATMQIVVSSEIKCAVAFVVVSTKVTRPSVQVCAGAALSTRRRPGGMPASQLPTSCHLSTTSVSAIPHLATRPLCSEATIASATPPADGDTSRQ